MNQVLDEICKSRQTHTELWIYKGQVVHSGFIFGCSNFQSIRKSLTKVGLRFRTEGQTERKASLICSGHSKERENPDRVRSSIISQRELDGKDKQARKTVGFKLPKDRDCKHRLTLVFDNVINSWKAG